MLGERRAELAQAMLSRRRGRRSISVATAKLRKIIEKTKHFPNYFLTKAPPRHKETEAVTDFRFSILIFGEQIKESHMTGTWCVSYLIFVFLTSKQKKVRKSLEDNRKIPIFASSEH